MSDKKKYTKVGAVLQGQKNNTFIVLGNTKAKLDKYNYTVDIKVTNGEGKVLTEMSNGIVSVFDPRTRPGITAEEAERIPKTVLFELFIVE